MIELFVRTISQGLQAFMPLGIFLGYVRAANQPALGSAARWSMAAAALLTLPAGYLFQRTSHQAGWEALLATAAIAIAYSFSRTVRADSLDRPVEGWRLVFVAAALTLIVVRQTLEIEVVLQAALFEVRSLEATLAVCGATLTATALACLWPRIARRLRFETLRHATLAFSAVFLVQALIYAFHESAEARVLPWSDVLHTATEPYGPEGVYGRAISYLLWFVPVVVAVALTARARLGGAARTPKKRPAFAAASVLALACVALIAAEDDGARTAADAATAAPAGASLAITTAAPHLVFRHTGTGDNYNMMTVAPLDRPSAGTATGLRCERVSFAAGRGICLQADRRMFTTYKAVFFDRDAKPAGSMTLAGSPSRTRVAPDGRVGAFTVFVSGHAYAATGFSTQTMLLDMTSGDPLGELEQFTTWRNGARFKAADFNFWGVTFTRDSNIFYASLGTGGTTYLLKGDLGLRKLTVVLDNVECPSLSPDNRLIAFKRRVSPAADAWRLYVLDLATMAARPLAAESRFVDDQVEWLDNGHVLYAMQRTGSATSDVWVAPVGDGGAARVYLSEASSPIVVR